MAREYASGVSPSMVRFSLDGEAHEGCRVDGGASSACHEREVEVLTESG